MRVRKCIFMILSHTEYLQSQTSPNLLCVSVPLKKMFGFCICFHCELETVHALMYCEDSWEKKTPVIRRNSVLDEDMHLGFTNKPTSPDLLITRSVVFSDLK